MLFMGGTVFASDEGGSALGSAALLPDWRPALPNKAVRGTAYHRALSLAADVM